MFILHRLQKLLLSLFLVLTLFLPSQLRALPTPKIHSSQSFTPKNSSSSRTIARRKRRYRRSKKRRYRHSKRRRRHSKRRRYRRRKTPPTSPIDLNKASAKQLMQLPRIGKKTAQKILRLRRTLGRFSNIDQLLEVRGIGKKTLQRIKPYLCLACSKRPVFQFETYDLSSTPKSHHPSTHFRRRKTFKSFRRKKTFIPHRRKKTTFRIIKID